MSTAVVHLLQIRVPVHLCTSRTTSTRLCRGAEGEARTHKRLRGCIYAAVEPTSLHIYHISP